MVQIHPGLPYAILCSFDRRKQGQRDLENLQGLYHTPRRRAFHLRAEYFLVTLLPILTILRIAALRQSAGRRAPRGRRAGTPATSAGYAPMRTKSVIDSPLPGEKRAPLRDFTSQRKCEAVGGRGQSRALRISSMTPAALA